MARSKSKHVRNKNIVRKKWKARKKRQATAKKSQAKK